MDKKDLILQSVQLSLTFLRLIGSLILITLLQVDLLSCPGQCVSIRLNWIIGAFA